MTVDGRPVGITQMPRLELSAGRHELKLINSELHKTISRVVIIEPGKKTNVNVDLER